MIAVCGIDAAWTAAQPSGLAVAVKRPAVWQLVAAEPSLDHFLAEGWNGAGAAARPRGAPIRAAHLLARAEELAGTELSLVAVDMPVARQPILGRRPCDDAVSRAFGRMGCGTHSPSAARPGAIADELRDGFLAEGFSLATERLTLPGLIEVYPHPALIILTEADYRLPYKIGRMRRYWPGLAPHDRRIRLLAEWRRIVAALDRQIAGSAERLIPPPIAAPTYAFKAFEDALDAVICAWVGVCALEGRAEPYGDAGSAIWVPKRSATGRA